MSSLRVDELRLHPWSETPLGAANARQSWPSRHGWVLELSSGPYRGLGEASPLPGYSPDTREEAEADLRGLEPTALQIDALRHPLEAVAELCAPVQSPAARFALESALLDLVGQRLARPVAALLGPERPGRRWVAEVLTGEPGSAAVAGARAWARRGVRALKVKVGREGAWSDELSLVRELASELPNVALRLDANQAFGVATRDRLQELSELGVEMIEEPGPPETWLDIRGPLPPIALDESLRRPDAEELLARAAPWLYAVVLKPAVLGGFSSVLAWAERAAGLGIPAVISHLFDGPVAAAGLRALALALPPNGPAHGLGWRRAGGAELLPEPGMGLGLPVSEAGTPRAAWGAEGEEGAR